MKKLVILIIILLAILHHDYWWWNDGKTLVFGFLPIGLAYHAGISLTAGFMWWLAIKYCWPKELDEEDTAEGGTA